MLLYMSLSLLFLSVVNADKVYNTSYLNEAKMQEYYNCISTLMCYEKLYDEFLKISEATKGKECHGDFMGSLSKAYLPGAVSALEYWKKFEDSICTENKGTRVARMQTLGASIGDHFQEHECQSRTKDPMCKCYFGLFETAEDMVVKYIKKEVCGDPEKEFKKLKNMGNMG